MGHPLALSKVAWIAASRKALHPLLPGSATGAVRPAWPRQISMAPRLTRN